MRRLLFLLLLIPFVAFGQKAVTYGGKVITESGKVVTISPTYCPEYQAVYDAYTTKPVDSIATFDNRMVKRLVDSGLWVRIDAFYFFAVHTNTAGEALLDWKQPAGGASLMDAGKGTFTTGTESWVAFGNNTIGNDAGALKVTYVNSEYGAYTYFSAGFDLSNNLTVGKTYKIYVRTKVNAGSTVNLRIDASPVTNTFATVNTTTFTWYSGIFVATHVTDNNLYMYAMGAGEIIWIDEWYIQEWTNATNYNAPTFTAYQGFLYNGTTQYTDHNFRPDVNGVNYTQNSASQILYIRTNIASEGQHGIHNVNKVENNIYLCPRYTDNKAYFKNNDNTSLNGANTNGSGLYINTRTAANVKILYRNGSVLLSGSTASVGLPTKKVYTSARNGNTGAEGFRADQVSNVAFANGFTQTDVTNYTLIIEENMDAKGTGVIP